MKFKVAFQGILYALKHETHMKIHALAAIAVIALATYFSVSSLEWIVLLICIGAVLSAEIFNSALEKLCDTLHPERAEGIKHVKDMAAGAVLVVAILSAVIALIVFVPYFRTLVQ